MIQKIFELHAFSITYPVHITQDDNVSAIFRIIVIESHMKYTEEGVF